MASQSVALFSVILRIIYIAHVHSAPITCGLQRTLVENSHSLMENMGGRFPLECLPHNVAIEFPTSAFQTGNATETLVAERAVYETLKFIDTLFENNSPPTTWNTENLDAFQNIIYRQIVESKCIKSGTPQGDFHIRESALKTYFAQVAELKNAGAEKMAYETLKLIDTLFANDSMPTSWNNNLEDFQSLIYRQIEESRCIMSKTHSSLDDFQDRNTTLKTFFDKIANILTEKESSICAWEVVRQHILSTLRFILQSSNYLL
ncbi:interferon alpha-13-like [Alosa pseudoharengus]|uniref:interferon alpha-13-like n=1 Tax=Alosa pseudoharengus TaxID=34774 RepID=UPI003F8B1EF2